MSVKTDEKWVRHSITQEDFTPQNIVDILLGNVDENTFTDFKKKVFDTSCGTGNILVCVLKKRLECCKSRDDAYMAMKTIFGIDIMADNVEICRERLYEAIVSKFNDIPSDEAFNFKLRSIIRCRIQWGDSLHFNYKNWPNYEVTPREKYKTVTFNVEKKNGHDMYPMYGFCPKRQLF